MRSLRQYAAELNKIGKREFKLQYGKPVLLGVGMVADVVAGATRGPSGTMKMTAVSEVEQVGSLNGRAWLITKGPDGPMGPAITVGRSAYNDMVIAEYTISNRHCQFRYEPGRLLLSDLGSLNGTYHNGRLLEGEERVKIRPQDTIVIGRFLFEFVEGADFFSRVEAALKEG